MSIHLGKAVCPFLVCAALLLQSPLWAAVLPTALVCEHLVEPLGIDAKAPRFSWRLQSQQRAQMQTAYRILVASTIVQLGNGKADVWDSGQVESDRAIDVAYAGPALASGTRYFWKVMVWNQAREASPWSEARWFETGLLDPREWQGRWIGRNAEPDPAPMVRREFTTDKPIASARLYICGLGFYEARINGRKVGDRVLDPPMSQYNRNVYYTTYDVTSAINKGDNAIGVELGRSWYCLTGSEGGAWGWDSAWWRKYPEVIVQLNIKYADGTAGAVVSDGSWKVCADGPLRHDSVYAGDTYDARKEKTGWDMPRYEMGPEWNAADLLPVPGGNGSIATLKSNMVPPCRVVATEKPVSVTRVRDRQVFRLAHNVAGWVRLRATAPAGTTIAIAHGERLNADGTVKVHRMDNKFDCQTYTYAFKGSGVETYEPKFSYCGFLFFEVVGFPGDLKLEDVDVRIVHNDVTTIGRFSCSNPLIDALHEGFCRTVVNNLHGKPTDTPMYEKNGWMGDFNFICKGALYNFDLTNFLEKWDDDISAYQVDNGGCSGVLCPSGHSDPNFGPPWNTVAVTVPWELLNFSGDRIEISKHYDNIKVLNDWLWSKLDANHLSPNDCWGPDWSTPSGDPAEGSQLTHSCYIYAAIKQQENMARILGKTEDANTYAERANAIRNSVNTKCYDAMAKMYHTSKECGFRQTSNVMPFGFDMIPEANKSAVIGNVANDVMKVHGGHLWTGAVGTPFLLPALTENGQGEVAYTIATKKDFPSWSYWTYQKDWQSTGTGWEGWSSTNVRSFDHFWLSSYEEWLFRDLAGIRPSAPGFKQITIKPFLLGDLTSASAQVETVSGLVSSRWTRDHDTVSLTVVIPPNATATVHVPASDSVTVKEGSVAASTASGVRHLRDEPGYAVYAVGSGSYQFLSPYPAH